MRSLFDEDFQDRIELQRRQVFHRELLEGHPGADATEAPREWLSAFPERTVERGDDLGLFAKLALILALVCFVFTIPAAVLSVLAALPIASLMKLLTSRASAFGDLYRRAAIAVFVSLCITAVAVGVVYALLDPSARIMVLEQFLLATRPASRVSALALLASFAQIPVEGGPCNDSHEFVHSCVPAMLRL